MDNQTDTAAEECNIHPSVFYLLGTLLFTSCSTAMLCAAIMTDHWELVTWDHIQVNHIANSTAGTKIEWLLDGKAAKVEDVNRLHTITFLLPTNGGIWTMCVSLSEEEIEILVNKGFQRHRACINYLGTVQDHNRFDDSKADLQFRMQNLSISCALVCLIVLGSASLVGAFGICQHQISAVLVTGVMYLLAGLFALFTLMIIHFKRSQREGVRTDGVIGNSGAIFLSARQFSTSWSLELGWAGVALTALTATLWILLSKIMRFNPLSAMLL